MASIYTDEQRKRLIAELKESFPEAADMYVSAQRFLYEDAFPGRIRFVCHAVRELMNSLLDAFVQDLPARNEARSKVAESDKILGAVLDKVDLSNPNDPKLEHPGLKPALMAFRDSRDEERQGIHRKRIHQFFRSMLDEEKTGSNASETLSALWFGTHKWFVGHAHLPEQIVNPEDYVARAKDEFETLEQCLFSLFSKHFEVIEELDDILQEANQ